jgi:signal peptidase I
VISLRPRFVALTVGTTLAAAAVGVLRWLFAVVTVHGPSMEPALADGDRLLVRRCGAGRLRRSQLVIFREPGLKRRRPVWLTGAGQDVWVIKRVAAVAGDPVPASVRAAAGGECVVPRHAVVVLGDGPVSRDSRDWGFVPASHILGVGARRIAAGPAASGGRATPRLAD